MMRKWFIGYLWLLGICSLPLCLFVIADIFIPGFDTRVNIFAAQLLKVREIATPPSDLIAAKSRWNANPVTHYSLQIQYSRSMYPFVNCSQTIEVLNEQVQKVVKDTCVTDNYLRNFSPLPQTITELFAFVEKDATTIQYKFVGSPECPYIKTVKIVYSVAGYPSRATYDIEHASPWNLGPETYRSIYGDDALVDRCLLVGANPATKPEMVITVQPLP